MGEGKPFVPDKPHHDLCHGLVKCAKRSKGDNYMRFNLLKPLFIASTYPVSFLFYVSKISLPN
jgi:hypothetical protein